MTVSWYNFLLFSALHLQRGRFVALERRGGERRVRTGQALHQPDGELKDFCCCHAFQGLSFLYFDKHHPIALGLPPCPAGPI